MIKALVRTISAAGIHVEYARTAPAEAITVTRPYAIGVAFTPQPVAVWDIGVHTRRRSAIQPASVFITASDPLNWQRWENVSESVEMWLDQQHLNELSHAFGGPSTVQFDLRDLIEDPIIVAIAARFRLALFDREPWDPMRIESLGVFLATHYLENYHGVRSISGERIRKLETAATRRVTDYIAANLDQPINLRALAQVSGQSPFHFAKSFRAATGVPPYAFITDRRMDRAMVLLRTTTLRVREVMTRVGFHSVSHFLRQFRHSWGQNPQEFRADCRD